MVEGSKKHQARRIIVVSAGVSLESTTTRLASLLGRESASAIGAEADIELLALRDHAREISDAISTGIVSSDLQGALDGLRDADGLIVATPVYKAGLSGLFTSFWDLAEDDAILATPVVLAATAGTPRHALVPDAVMRELFAYFRALPVPTSVFAATEDWSDPIALNKRVRRAAGELAVLVDSEVRTAIRGRNQSSYDRSMDALRTEEDSATLGIDFSTDMMRLAAGGV